MKGADLSPEMLWSGYTQGYFPMTVEGDDVEWFFPEDRALLPIEGIRVSTSLRKVMRQGRFEVTFDQAFEDVMRACFRPEDNWLSEDFVRAYGEAHKQGWAHSCEAWHEGHLVGGVYGLAIGGCFCAESMFHRETDAGKVALAAMVERCGDLGFDLFDVQIMNPHLASLGAYEVPHEEYLTLLRRAMAVETPWSAVANHPDSRTT